MATNLVVRNVDEKIALELKQQAAHQFEWIDMIGIVGPMKQAQPRDLRTCSTGYQQKYMK